MPEQGPESTETKGGTSEQHSKIFEMRNCILYRNTMAMESHVLYRYHDEIEYVGIDKTDLISGSYWFPRMKGKVAEHVCNCLRCRSLFLQI